MFYIFHGDDTHSQRETLAALKNKMGDHGMLDLNTTRFDKPMGLSELYNACDVMPFLAKVRLVIVYDLFTSKLDKSFEKELLVYLPTLPETTRLFFLESKPLRHNHAIIKLAEANENGYVKLFNKPEGAALEHWIRQQVSERNGRIAPQATHILAVNVGSDLQILDNEIEKLLLYKAEEEITVKDVELLSPYAAEANIFDLVDAIGNRNSKQASLLLQKKFAEGADPFYLFSMFIRQFRLLLQVKELVESGLRPPDIAKALNMHSFVVGKLSQQCHGFSLPQLEQIYHHLLEIDVGVKTGRHEMVTALHLLVAGLTVTG
jgi:DNA polymerase III subunit delta